MFSIKWFSGEKKHTPTRCQMHFQKTMYASVIYEPTVKLSVCLDHFVAFQWLSSVVQGAIFKTTFSADMSFIEPYIEVY